MSTPDDVGRRAWLLALAIFVTGSALCAAAWSVEWGCHAFEITFAWVLGLTVLSFVPALLLPGRDHQPR
ncbi:hypothetical protein [Mycobacterium sp. AZCC_0083]|uniref:hypothetical protein n=1 Tax=Mycobacterium sp. AZCC_0083 TaxID=2735882 RepID=UPI00160FEDDA|nr:hypothetical protein [Mycobacterium sp. AZCC_0083]MBB5161296.1 hypothetical protein [Mycobacterium sp. AZCC_0083]